MKRIRKKNINTAEYFNSRFEENSDYYLSPWKNLTNYSNKFKLSIFDKGSILDYGCGDGKHLEQYSVQTNYATAGVDISNIVIKKNQDKYKNSKFYLKDEMLKRKLKYNHVVSTHTIEHTDHPIKEIQNLMNVAENTLTIVVPYKNSWQETEEHIWYFDKHSFDCLKPSIVRTGITNMAGNTEIIFHWNFKVNYNKKVFTIYPSYPFVYPMIFWFFRKNLPADLKKYLKYFKFF